MNKKEPSPLCTLHLNTTDSNNIYTATGPTTGKVRQTWNIDWKNTLPPEFFDAPKLLCSHEFSPSRSNSLFSAFANPAARFYNGSSQVWIMYSNLSNSSYNSTQQTSNFLNVATIENVHPHVWYDPNTTLYGDAQCARKCKPRYFIASNPSRSSELWIEITSLLYTTANWGGSTNYTNGIHTFKFYSVVN